MNQREAPAVLPAPSSVMHAIDILSALDPQSFSDVVDRDIRGNERLQEDELPLDPLFAAALRSEILNERWYHTLVRMKKSTELTIAAKGMDDKRSRQKIEARGDFVRARDVHSKHLQWRAGAVRFLTGVETRMSEASYLRRLHFGNRLPSQITQERDQLSELVRLLQNAIASHRDEQLSLDGDEPSEADVELWAVLDDKQLATELN